MRIIIVEDELPAFNRIKKLILEIHPDTEILGHADSITSAVSLFNTYPDVELALLDIELADGQSFEIFNQVKVTCPIIFTTAYDEFALKAFKVNSIDYLLKPIDPNELKQALDKFKQLQNKKADIDLNQLLRAFQPAATSAYKQRFLVKLGQKLISIAAQDIAYFMAADKVVYLVAKDQRKFIVDHSIEELANLMNPTSFYHLNRQFLANLDSIESVSSYFNGKLKISLRPSVAEEVLVSREKASDFKLWLNT
ncbi:MAG: DNA-binding response regulator [Bacteroidetes bacterium B1(2017)]|nr:MAG: DNA-binding response regulator [Bacteroidetes bacterium B1(2017)]